MNEVRILGVLVSDRMKEAGEFQGTLTKYGCSIKTRLGLHEVTEKTCARNGLVLLELAGNPAEWDKLEADLKKIQGLDIQKMSFKL